MDRKKNIPAHSRSRGRGWYGSEAFDSYFANNWEFVAMFQGAEGEDGRFTMTRIMPPSDPQ